MNPSVLIKQLCVSFLVIAGLATSHAAIVVDINQVGSDVVASGSGTINLTALTLDGGAWVGGWLYPSYPGGSIAAFGAGESANLFFGSLTGPLSIGTGGNAPASFGTGDSFGVLVGEGLYVPQGYVSGHPLSGSATWAETTFSGLGITEGTYTWTWGNGANADSFTLNIGTEAVPEPSSYALIAMGLFVAGGVAMRNRRK